MLFIKYINLLFIWFFAVSVKAQFNKTIRTVRLGQSIGAFSVGTNAFQLQLCADFGGVMAENLKSNGDLCT